MNLMVNLLSVIPTFLKEEFFIRVFPSPNPKSKMQKYLKYFLLG